MRDMRSGVCALCEHGEVVAAPAQSGYKSHYNRVIAAVVDAGGFFEANQEVGAVRIYACRRCGFAQTFVDAPEKIPIGQKHGTEIVRGKR